jgi:hypothetical protein
LSPVKVVGSLVTLTASGAIALIGGHYEKRA